MVFLKYLPTNGLILIGLILYQIILWMESEVEAGTNLPYFLQLEEMKSTVLFRTTPNSIRDYHYMVLPQTLLYRISTMQVSNPI